jgi:hypothetical protein
MLEWTHYGWAGERIEQRGDATRALIRRLGTRRSSMELLRAGLNARQESDKSKLVFYSDLLS